MSAETELTDEQRKKLLDEYALAYLNSMTFNELRTWAFNSIYASATDETDEDLVQLAADLNLKPMEKIDGENKTSDQQLA
jgi:hypothetical protein